jgi:hypothetical protein
MDSYFNKNWTGLTGWSGYSGLRPKNTRRRRKNPVNPVYPVKKIKIESYPNLFDHPKIHASVASGRKRPV